MVFLKVVFMKGLLLYLGYFYFKCANFSRVKLKVILKLSRESSVSEKFFIRAPPKSLLSNNDKEYFTFTSDKGHSGDRHKQFIVIRYFRFYSTRFDKKGSHIYNNMINGRNTGTHVTSWCFDHMT